MRLRPAFVALATLFALSLPASAAGAQVGMPMQGVTDGQVFWFLQNLPPASAKPLGGLINALLSDTAGHMKMAEPRVATPADSARAAELLRTIRSSLGQYADVAMAERDSFVRFMPWLEEQVVYHYNNMRNAGAARRAFDATKPTSLLYKKDAGGKLMLVGAMYTAPASSTPEELDARLPLGIAHWHQHVNFCAMRPGVAADVVAKSDSAMFAQWLAIETPEACKAAGGFFVPQLFGWMAHVNAWEGDTPGAVWGHAGRNQMHMHHQH
jgi:hypothetical protein